MGRWSLRTRVEALAGAALGGLGARAQVGLKLHHLQERLHHLRVEVRPGFVHDQVAGALVRPAGAVRPVAGKGVVDVGHGEDSSGERDVLRAQAIGIAAPVPFFVVAPHGTDHRRRELHRLQNADAQLGVALDQRELVVGEASRLVQNVLGNRDLPDVVEGRAGRDRADFLVGQSQLLGERDGDQLDALDVLLGVLVFGVDGEREGFDGGGVHLLQLRLALCQRLDVRLLLDEARRVLLLPLATIPKARDENGGNREPGEGQQKRHPPHLDGDANQRETEQRDRGAGQVGGKRPEEVGSPDGQRLLPGDERNNPGDEEGVDKKVNQRDHEKPEHGEGQRPDLRRAGKRGEPEARKIDVQRLDQKPGDRRGE